MNRITLTAAGAVLALTVTAPALAADSAVCVPVEPWTETTVITDAWTETITHPEVTEDRLVTEAWTETVTVTEAWTERIEHDAVTAVEEKHKRWVVTHEAVAEESHTDHEWKWWGPLHHGTKAWTHDKAAPADKPRDLWGEWRLTGKSKKHVTTPAQPERGEWEYAWGEPGTFSREWKATGKTRETVVTEAWVELIEHPAVTETIEHPEVWETVLVTNAWVETVEHPAVTETVEHPGRDCPPVDEPERPTTPEPEPTDEPAPVEPATPEAPEEPETPQVVPVADPAPVAPAAPVAEPTPTATTDRPERLAETGPAGALVALAVAGGLTLAGGGLAVAARRRADR